LALLLCRSCDFLLKNNAFRAHFYKGTTVANQAFSENGCAGSNPQTDVKVEGD